MTLEETKEIYIKDCENTIKNHSDNIFNFINDYIDYLEFYKYKKNQNDYTKVWALENITSKIKDNFQNHENDFRIIFYELLKSDDFLIKNLIENLTEIQNNLTEIKRLKG